MAGKAGHGGQPGRSGRKRKLPKVNLAELLDEVVAEKKRKAVAERLLAIALDDPDAKTALRAIEVLWGYMYGKPAQTVDLNARMVTEYDVIWSEDRGETSETPSLTDGSEESSGTLQGAVLRAALGQDTTGLIDVHSDGA